MMRSSSTTFMQRLPVMYCDECVAKHIGAAIVCASEAENGYPTHRYLVIGHLAEAERECRDDGMRETIRVYRKDYWETGEGEKLAELLDILDEADMGSSDLGTDSSDLDSSDFLPKVNEGVQIRINKNIFDPHLRVLEVISGDTYQVRGKNIWKQPSLLAVEVPGWAATHLGNNLFLMVDIAWYKSLTLEMT